MSDSDDRIARRYRELSREEPRAALDDAILAASRRAVAQRPMGARRWAAPVSIAAVLVLAFGVTLEMQREEPGIATTLPPPVVPAPAATPSPQSLSNAPSSAAPAPVAPPSPRPTHRAPEPMSPKAMAPIRAVPSHPAAQPSIEDSPAIPSAFPRATTDANIAPAAPPADTPAPAANQQAAPPARMAPRMKAEAADAMQRSAAPAAQGAGEETIDRELERIARLRDEGRVDEADKALEQFRRDHPGYRIPEPVWSRVRPR
jgi:hypothetical protein